MLVEPLALLRESAASPEDIASSAGRSSAVSLNTSFRISGEPLCTCASEASRSDFVSNAWAVSPQPRLPLDRAVDSEEPPPSPELSGRLMFGVASQL